MPPTVIGVLIPFLGALSGRQGFTSIVHKKQVVGWLGVINNDKHVTKHLDIGG